MGSIPPGGWGVGPRGPGPEDDYQEREHRAHYGLWGVARGSLLASLLVARSQGRSMGGVLLRGLLLVVAIYALVMVIGGVSGLFAH